jgi:serine-type D-Ala-D-Ala carboxypeptidase (penicillin-binding protein 5/6)
VACDVRMAAMRSYAFICLLVSALVISGAIQPASAQAQDAGLTCHAYLIYDISAQRIIDAYNADSAQPIASITKLMTAIIATEKLRFDGRYVLTDKERAQLGTDTLRAQKMLELMLIPSNNTVCSIVARIVSGNETAFARLMNERAQDLGLRHTRFANPHGLPAKGQYSTPQDVLRLFLQALNHPQIVDALMLHQTQINGKAYPATLMPLYKRHPGLLTGKTGYTKASGRCLVLYYRTWRTGGIAADYIIISFGSKGVKESFRDAELLLKRYGLYAGEVAQWN